MFVGGRRQLPETYFDRSMERNTGGLSTISDGTFLYPYDNCICYFDTLIEKF